MKIATLKSSDRDGKLVVVSRNLEHAVPVPEIASTLQGALENWNTAAPQLEKAYQELNRVPSSGIKLISETIHAPLPRAYQWLDGSAYLSHVERVRKARGAKVPESFKTDPLMYQGGSDKFLGPCDPIEVENEEWGIDFESEVAVITDAVQMGITPREAAKHIKLLMLVNDVSLRNLIPAELAKGFGFIQGKPATAFSPCAITPDELGDAWKNSKICLPLITKFNGKVFGSPNAGSNMQFNFGDLIAHAAKTRHLSAGTIIGSGTVSNDDATLGFSCLAEKRVVEKVEEGEAKTQFMSFGDTVRIEMLDDRGNSIFGKIEQVVKPYRPVENTEPDTTGEK